MLLSGGIDSAVVAGLLCQNRPVTGVWVDYGQAAAAAESEASERIAEHLLMPLRKMQIPSISPAAGGEIPHRNDLLLTAALASYPKRSVAIGIHAGTGYADCSPEWVSAWRQLLDLQSGGETQLLAPLLKLSKGEVYAVARRMSIPLEMSHSCEVSDVPCGGCRSCLDRSVLGVRA